MARVGADTGVPGTALDGTEATSADLNRPMYVLALADGRVSFTERGNGRVRRFETDGKLYTTAGDGGTGPIQPGVSALRASFGELGGIARSPNGDVYVVDSRRREVYRVAPPLDAYVEGSLLVPA